MFNRVLGFLAAISVISISIYFFVRIYFFGAGQYSTGNFIFGLLLLIGEIYMIVQAIGFMLGVFRISNKRDFYKIEPLLGKDQPWVAVVVAAKEEPKEVLFETFVTLRSLDYKNKNIYLLDDSVDKKFLKQDKEICQKLGVRVFHPDVLHGAKAGIENDFLKEMKEEYLAVFDADQNPAPDFLQVTVALAERDKKIGFVQTPQLYSNIDTSPITKAAAMQQSIFYESICEAKGSVNAMFCCGTNVLFRKQVLVDVGGFDESSITEDFATSIKIHLAGWKSIYYNHVRVFGLGPETLSGYMKQQFRWAAGTIGVFRKVAKEFFKNPFRLSAVQWWEYFLSGTYYYIGLAFMLLMICPIAYLLLGVPSYFMGPYVYLASYAPYFILTLLVFYSTMRKRHYGVADIYRGMIMGSMMFPLLVYAAIAGTTGMKLKFVVTPKGKGDLVPFAKLWPWHLAILLNLVAILIGIGKIGSNTYAISVNMFWASYHIFILSHIYYYNRTPKIEKAIIPKEFNA